jgi:protein-L-isoaspartate O-methyltransferase
VNFTETAILTNFYVSASRPDNQFEEKYLNARRKERRLYSDEQVLALPEVQKGEEHYEEWMIRKHSCERLMKWIEAKNKKLNVLEVGCGNGWFSHQLSKISKCHVIGSDINLVELQQAVRVFPKKQNLKFIYGDIRSGMQEDMLFDIILFADSIQYFPSLSGILNTALPKLSAQGEIHILDSPFYKQSQLLAAREKTRIYYDGLGFPDMAHCHFHHGYSALDAFKYRLLCNPNSLKNRIFTKNPFPWIFIKNN